MKAALLTAVLLAALLAGLFCPAEQDLLLSLPAPAAGPSGPAPQHPAANGCRDPPGAGGAEGYKKGAEQHMEFLTREDSDRLAARVRSMWLLGLHQSPALRAYPFDERDSVPLYYATLMDCRSHYILAAWTGAGQLDRRPSEDLDLLNFDFQCILPRDIYTSLSREHRPSALLMPAEYPEAVSCFGEFLVKSCGFPADRIIWRRGGPLAVQSGMYLWHRQLDLWESSLDPSVLHDPPEVGFMLGDLVNDRNYAALSPLEKQAPEESYYRRLRKLSLLRPVPFPEEDEQNVEI